MFHYKQIKTNYLSFELKLSVVSLFFQNITFPIITLHYSLFITITTTIITIVTTIIPIITITTIIAIINTIINYYYCIINHYYIIHNTISLFMNMLINPGWNHENIWKIQSKLIWSKTPNWMKTNEPFLSLSLSLSLTLILQISILINVC